MRGALKDISVRTLPYILTLRVCQSQKAFFPVCLVEKEIEVLAVGPYPGPLFCHTAGVAALEGTKISKHDEPGWPATRVGFPRLVFCSVGAGRNC